MKILKDKMCVLCFFKINITQSFFYICENEIYAKALSTLRKSNSIIIINRIDDQDNRYNNLNKRYFDFVANQRLPFLAYEYLE